jgi:polyhydroxyalkanoate synthesis repressor PhaR
MAKSDQPTTIKKYANRRLYNTGTSTYVTLEDLASMVKDGEDFLVYDAKTGDDITRSVLAQIIFEQENKAGQNLLPTTFLRQLIRFYGDSMQMVVPKYLEQAIASLSYYAGTRVLLQARSRFWRSADLSGSARTDRATEVWDSTFDQVASRRGILGASFGGAVGRTVLDMTAQDSLAFGIGLVADAFPGIRSEFEKGFVQRWALDPWSRGAFPVFKPGEMSTLMPAIARPENGIHFAGEHTSSWTGWMEGALQSGERAAREVLNS